MGDGDVLDALLEEDDDDAVLPDEKGDFAARFQSTLLSMPSGVQVPTSSPPGGTQGQAGASQGALGQPVYFPGAQMQAGTAQTAQQFAAYAAGSQPYVQMPQPQYTPAGQQPYTAAQPYSQPYVPASGKPQVTSSVASGQLPQSSGGAQQDASTRYPPASAQALGQMPLVPGPGHVGSMGRPTVPMPGMQNYTQQQIEAWQAQQSQRAGAALTKQLTAATSASPAGTAGRPNGAVPLPPASSSSSGGSSGARTSNSMKAGVDLLLAKNVITADQYKQVIAHLMKLKTQANTPAEKTQWQKEFFALIGNEGVEFLKKDQAQRKQAQQGQPAATAGGGPAQHAQRAQQAQQGAPGQAAQQAQRPQQAQQQAAAVRGAVPQPYMSNVQQAQQQMQMVAQHHQHLLQQRQQQQHMLQQQQGAALQQAQAQAQAGAGVRPQMGQPQGQQMGLQARPPAPATTPGQGPIGPPLAPRPSPPMPQGGPPRPLLPGTPGFNEALFRSAQTATPQAPSAPGGVAQHPSGAPGGAAAVPQGAPRPQGPPGPQAAGVKRPAAKAPSGQPASKKQGTGKTTVQTDFGDVFEGTGVNLEEEAVGLTSGQVPAVTSAGAALDSDLLLNDHPVSIMVRDTARRHGLSAATPALHQYLSQLVEAHLTSLLQQSFHVAKHRTDPSRRAAGMQQVDDLRRKVLLMEKEEREKVEAKEAAEREELLKAAADKKGKADEETQEKVKKVRAAEHEKQAKSDANLAARKALGGDDARWNKWANKSGGAAGKKGAKGGGAAGKGGSAAAGATPASGGAGGGPAGKGPTKAGAAAVGLPASRVAAVAAPKLGMRDLLSVMERDPKYCKSPLLYRLMEQRTH